MPKKSQVSKLLVVVNCLSPTTSLLASFTLPIQCKKGALFRDIVFVIHEPTVRTNLGCISPLLQYSTVFETDDVHTLQLLCGTQIDLPARLLLTFVSQSYVRREQKDTGT